MRKHAALQGDAATMDTGATSSDRRNRVVLVLTYSVLVLYLAASHGSGNPLNGDADDLLRLHQLRNLMTGGAIFNRTLPDILQPEPFISHWPWIVDLPYALVALPASTLIGMADAIHAATLLVPLLLLAPALFFYDGLLGATGFSARTFALPLAVLIALPGFQEFAPGRIDYHNLQILLLLASLLLLTKSGRAAAVVNGTVVATAIAISPEFIAFHALIMGFYAFDYVFVRAGGSERMASFGIGLTTAAIILFAGIVPPADYGLARCDSYSAPFVLALVLAGVVFAALPAVAIPRRWTVRISLLLALAASSLAIVAAQFPQCLAGPYAGMDEQIRDYFLGSIGQEKSFLQRGDFVLSESLMPLTVWFIGALGPLAFLLLERRPGRAVIVVALFSLLAVAQALFYFRYLRYVPFFSGLGLVIVAAYLAPPLAKRFGLDIAFASTSWTRILVVMPGLGLTVLLLLYYMIVSLPPARPTASDIAGTGCGYPQPFPAMDWPAGSVVLASPRLGVQLLAMPDHPAVIATPHHPAARGMARVARFLEPGEEDPRTILAEAQANFVAVCANHSFPSTLRTRLPFAASLIDGPAPPWLHRCPETPGSGLRIYRLDGIGCPAFGKPLK